MDALTQQSINWTEKDREFLWHPFSQMLVDTHFPCLVRGEGAYLYDIDGLGYLDAVSSWWCNLHGHCHPHIVQQLQMQASQLCHVSFGDFTHQPAIQLAERLLKLLPPIFKKVFYSNSGSEAIEASIKMAIQYFFNSGMRRNGVISLNGSYHGDTFGCMSASSRSPFTEAFSQHLFPAYYIDPPLEENVEKSERQLINIIKESNSVPACFIFEPLLQGASGMRTYSALGLDRLLAICHQNGIITIADEVLTGFGRTGKLFAIDYLEVKPDILCLAKGLTGGTLPLSATICSQKIFTAFLSYERIKGFLHGHTYGANPLACSAALASLDLLNRSDCREAIEQISFAFAAFVQKWSKHPLLRRCQSLGTILAIEYRDNELGYASKLRDRLRDYFLNHKIMVRPLGNTLVIAPPYCLTPIEITKVLDLIENTLEDPYVLFN